MKILHGNGRVLEARDVGPVLVRFRTRPEGPPIKFNGHRIMSDDEARAVLEGIRDTGLYDRDA